MHSFLRAVGFSEYTNTQQIKKLIKDVIENRDEQIIAEDNNFVMAEMPKSYGTDFGICVCGEYDEDGVFDTHYYYPYFNGNGLSTQEIPEVERHADKESYAGVCEDYKVGVSLIFYLQNVAEYKNEKRLKEYADHFLGVTLSGLSLQGSILLPTSKNEQQKKEYIDATQNRNKLIAAAKQGDEEAIESLTLEDIDMYTMIARRVVHEDVLSIVETYFMPYGVECDQFSILGEIMDFRLEQNSYTGEEVYIMSLDCNDLLFDVCINAKDLLGEPAIGRRFKGNIWMQGRIRYGS